VYDRAERRCRYPDAERIDRGHHVGDSDAAAGFWCGERLQKTHARKEKSCARRNACANARHPRPRTRQPIPFRQLLVHEGTAQNGVGLRKRREKAALPLKTGFVADGFPKPTQRAATRGRLPQQDRVEWRRSHRYRQPPETGQNACRCNESSPKHN
jgi:hypothetical protein